MFCIKCGCKLDDDAVFCTECGTRVAELEENNQESEITGEKDTTYVESSTSIESNKKVDATSLTQSRPFTGKDKKYIAIGFVFLIAVAIIAVIMNRKPSINLNDYITVEANGYNTFGKANIVFDSESFLNDFESISSAKEEPEPEYEDGSFEEFMYGMSELMNEAQIDSIIGGDINWEANKTENLSNGDVVEVKWNCNDEHIKEKYGCILKYKDISYKVENLETAETIDPFEGIELKITDDNGYPQFQVINTNSDEARSIIQYSVENTLNVKNGNYVNVVISTNVEDFAKNYGMVWNESSKEFLVSGLKEYVSEISQLTDNPVIIKDLYNKSSEICENMNITDLHGYEDNWGNVSIEEVTPLGIDFLGLGKDNSATVINRVKIHYSFPAYGMDDEWYTFYPVWFTGLLLDGNGEFKYNDARAQLFSSENVRDIYWNGIELGEEIVLPIKYEGFQTYDEYFDYMEAVNVPVQRNYNPEEFKNVSIVPSIAGKWASQDNKESELVFCTGNGAGTFGIDGWGGGTYSVEGDKITVQFNYVNLNDFEPVPPYTAHLEIKNGELYYLDDNSGYNINVKGKYYKEK